MIREVLLALTDQTPTREVFRNADLISKVVFYVASTAAIAAFLYGWWRRIRKYTRGRKSGRISALWWGWVRKRREDVRPVMVSALRIGGNTTVAERDLGTGIAHFLVFWGFITLFLGTVILTIDYDIVRNATRLLSGREASFFQGPFYVVYSVVLDTLGLACVGGLLYLAIRRGRHPPQLDYTRAERPAEGYSRHELVLGDWLFVGLLGAVLITGFLEEGLRIRATGFPSFEVWSPVGWLVARAARAVGMGAGTAETARAVWWWIHTALALAFVAYVPFSKAMHIIVDVFNLIFNDPTSTHRLPGPVPGADHVGYRILSDFTWKELLDLDACTKCGRCHVVCPATASGAPLSPRDLILDLRQWADSTGGTQTLLDHEHRPEATGPLATGDGQLSVAGDVIKEQTLWACTTCMACVEACPVGIEHVPTIVQMRRSLVDEGRMEPTLQAALQNIAQQGNSFGRSGRQRAKWTRGLDFEIPDARKEPVEYLWFVGDFASFDERLQENSRALARILHDAGVEFGMLYDGEWNAGNDVRRVGEEGLFELLVEHNLEAFRSARFREVFTTDPHSFNTLRNEYPAFGLDAPVKHYTELLAELIGDGRIPVGSLGRQVTYHDPCYLARYNGLTDPPRRILEALGCNLIEMPRNGANTFCCGAGGGRIWMDDSNLTERPSESRIREAAVLDVGEFVVSCPKDFTMYSDAAKTTGHDDRLAVVDVVRLVEQALDRERLAERAPV